jgi:hypothetical protein
MGLAFSLGIPIVAGAAAWAWDRHYWKGWHEQNR